MILDICLIGILSILSLVLSMKFISYKILSEILRMPIYFSPNFILLQFIPYINASKASFSGIVLNSSEYLFFIPEIKLIKNDIYQNFKIVYYNSHIKIHFINKITKI